MSPQIAFLVGILVSPVFRSKLSVQDQAKKLMTYTLQVSIVLQGIGLDFNRVLTTGKESFLLTLFSIIAIFGVGYILARLSKLDKTLSLLIIMGTAICGGSAIAALAPVLAASASALSISLALVFGLNIVAIYLFPFLGHWLDLSQHAFGTWAALAIHDTSSVTAAATAYGAEALNIATTIKLTRALWIIPVTLAFSILKSGKAGKVKIPWFIAGFIIASLLFTHVSFLHPYASTFAPLAKAGFTMTLFLLGMTFDFQMMKSVSLRPILFGIVLWILVSVACLTFVLS
jgi:uncharacterized integral membrane protein (TIGR00698 family)